MADETKKTTTKYQQVQYGTGLMVPRGLMVDPRIKHWTGSNRFWRYIPRCLWGVLRRPYEMKSFVDCLRDASNRLSREMDEQIMRDFWRETRGKCNT